jgi:hypothetical protein
VSLAQFALPQWPALAIAVSGEHGSAGVAAADGTLAEYPQASNWISAATANLSALFFLDALVIGRDALAPLYLFIRRGSSLAMHRV